MPWHIKYAHGWSVWTRLYTPPYDRNLPSSIKVDIAYTFHSFISSQNIQHAYARSIKDVFNGLGRIRCNKYWSILSARNQRVGLFDLLNREFSYEFVKYPQTLNLAISQQFNVLNFQLELHTWTWRKQYISTHLFYSDRCLPRRNMQWRQWSVCRNGGTIYMQMFTGILWWRL